MSKSSTLLHPNSKARTTYWFISWLVGKSWNFQKIQRQFYVNQNQFKPFWEVDIEVYTTFKGNNLQVVAFEL